MPQFAVETFSSQIFWVLFGFLAIYVFMSLYATPALQESLKERDSYVSSLINKADECNRNAKDIEMRAEAALKEAERGFAVTESQLIASFKEQNLKKKQSLDKVFAEESRKESDNLIASSDMCFQFFQESSEEMIEAAAKKIVVR